MHFDGSTWLSTASSIAADSSLVTYSGWVKNSTQPSSNPWWFFDFDPPSLEMGPNIRDSSAAISSAWADAAGSSFINSQSAASAWAADGNWHHIFGYADTNHVAGLKVIKVFLDAVDITGTTNDIASAFTIPFGSIGIALPDDTDNFGNPQFTGDVADWWIAPGVLHTDITTFRDSGTGKPKNPSGFPSSAILFSGDHVGFATNQGTGGTFILTGTLIDASTHP